MVRFLVSYLEQFQPPAGPILSSPVPDARVAKERLEPDDYLSLYRLVGDPLRWDERLRMSKAELGEFLLRLRQPSTFCAIGCSPPGFASLKASAGRMSS